MRYEFGIDNFVDCSSEGFFRDVHRSGKTRTTGARSRLEPQPSHSGALQGPAGAGILSAHDPQVRLVMIDLLADHTELLKQFSDNPSFKKWLGDTIFGVTFQQQSGQSAAEGESRHVLCLIGTRIVNNFLGGVKYVIPKYIDITQQRVDAYMEGWLVTRKPIYELHLPRGEP